MKRKQLWMFAVFGLLLLAPTIAAQKKKDDSGNARTVQGTVTAADQSAVNGAVVQLKNLKTLQIRSFITKEDGAYYFNGLSPDIDYELRADYQGESSRIKTLSSFDDRKQAIVNLELKKK
jgi:Carboxypeptidase regulatory-like domain